MNKKVNIIIIGAGTLLAGTLTLTIINSLKLNKFKKDINCQFEDVKVIADILKRKTTENKTPEPVKEQQEQAPIQEAAKNEVQEIETEKPATKVINKKTTKK